ncbi:MAG: hypothetical protein IJ087_11295 [Eggerthellaceae bacterium]|nr:hypothetical protein [Eggerthellaceae bacterium]
MGGEFDHGDKVAAPSGSGVLYPKGKALVKGPGESTYTVQPTLAAFKVTFSPESAIIEPGGYAGAPTVAVEPYDGLTAGAVTLGENDAVITFDDKADLPNPTEPGEYEVKVTGAEGSTFAGTSKSAEKKFKVEHGVVACTSGSTTQNYTKFTDALKFANQVSDATTTTIKLFGNVNLVDEGVSSNNVDVSKKVVLDLNGHTLTTPDNVFRPEGQTAELTITDSSEGAKGVFAAAGTVLRAKDNAKIVIEKGTIRSTAVSDTEYYNAISVLNGCSITMNGGAIEAVGSAIMSSGQADAGQPTYGNGAQITVKGGTISSQKECAIYAPAVSGQATIEGGTITGATGIELRAGKLAVTGGSITGTAASLKCESNGNGATTYGAGIAIVQHLTEDDMEVAISGNPTISGYHALYQNQVDGSKPENIKLSVSGGTFDGARGQDAVLVNSITVKNSASGALHFISGGLFSSDPSKLSSGVESNYVASDKRVIGDGSKWYYSVGAGTVKKPVISNNSFVYDGSEHAPIELTGYEGYMLDPSASTVKATDVGTYKLVFYPSPGFTWEGETNNTAAHEITWSITACDLSAASLTVQSASFTYDGSERTPTVQVIAGNRVVNPGDYTLEYYSGSTKISGAPSAAGTYKVVAKAKSSNYANATSETNAPAFTIEKAAVDKPADLVTVVSDLVYNGAAQTGVTLKDDVSWATLAGASATAVGEHKATVTLDGNHKWAEAGETGEVSYTIAKGTIKTVSLSADSAKHTGLNVAPTVTVKDANGATVDPSHYTVTFTREGAASGSAQAVDVGKYTVTVTADNSYSVNSDAKATFTVTEGDGGSGSGGGSGSNPGSNPTAVDQPVANANLVYNGQAQVGVPAAEGYTLSGAVSAKDAGSYTAKAKPKEGYAWKGKAGTDANAEITISWSIAKGTVSIPAGANLTYTGANQVVVQAGSGYTLSIPAGNPADAFVDRTTGSAMAANVGTGTVNATLSDAKNYQWGSSAAGDTIQITWAIRSAETPSVADDSINVRLSGSSFTYTGSQIRPTVFVSDARGQALSQGSDYMLSYGANVNAGTGYVYVTYQSNGERKQVSKAFTIGKALITSASSTSSNQTYSGKAIKPKVSAKAGSTTLSSDDYSVKYSKNTNVGTATIAVTGKGNYTGTVKRSFRIVPQSTAITKLKRSDRGFTVKWAKQNVQTSGYQIQYSRSKSFSGSSITATVSRNTTLSKAVSVAKNAGKYFVHVRAYKAVNGQRYDSTWSATKSVKTK